MRILAAIVPASAGVLIWALAIAVPAGASISALLGASAWQDTALTPRRILLLAKGFGVAAAAGVVAVGLGAALAPLLLRAGRAAPAVRAALLSVFLLPPYVYAYAWSLLVWPAGLPTSASLAPSWTAALGTGGRAVLCLATWLAPVPAILIEMGWRSAAAPVYRLAIVETRAARAVLRGAGAMWAWLWLALGVTVALALLEFSVCHFCLVQTLNTEILAEAQRLGRPGTAVALGWPLAALVVLLCAAVAPALRRSLQALDAINAAAPQMGVDLGSAPLAPRGWWLPGLLAGGVLVAPLLILLAWIRDPGALLRTWLTYPGTWEGGLLCAAGAAAGGAVLALAVDLLRVFAGGRGTRAALARWSVRIIWIGLLAGLLAPPVIVGDAFLAAYAGVPLLADHWPIVSLVGVARFGLLPVAVLQLQTHGRRAELDDAASMEGAGRVRAHVLARGRPALRALLIGAASCGVLTLGEASATQLVAPPGVPNVAITLLNAIHFGRNDVVSALCVQLWGLIALVALLITCTRGRRTAEPRA